MADVLDLILRLIGALTLTVIAGVLVALLVIDRSHRRRGLQRPHPGHGRERPDNW